MDMPIARNGTALAIEMTAPVSRVMGAEPRMSSVIFEHAVEIDKGCDGERGDEKRAG